MADLTLTVDLDPKDAIQTAKNLKKEVQNSLDAQHSNKMSSQIEKINSQMEQSVNEASRLGKKLEEVFNKKVPTQEYEKLNTQMEKMQKSATKVEEKMSRSSAALKMQELYDRKDALQEQSATYGKIFGIGSQEQNVVDMNLKQVQREMEELQKSKEWKEYSALESELESIKSSMSDINKQKKEMESAGKAFVDPKSTDEYKKVEAQLDKVNDKTKILLLRKKEFTKKEVGGEGSGSFSLAAPVVAASAGVNKIFNVTQRLGRLLRRGVLTIAGITLGVRGLMGIINKIRSSIKEGFNYLMEGDKDLKKRITTLKDSIAEIKANLAAAFMPLIELAIPHIQKLIDWINLLISKLSMFIAATAGQKEYTKAIKATGDAASRASGQLSKFDELNNLNPGGGQWSTQKVPIGDMEKAKDLMGSIKNFLDGIDWDDVETKVRGAASKLAGAINKVFDPEFWRTIGSTLAHGFNTALDFLDELGKDIDWVKVGASIAGFFGGLFDPENETGKKLKETIKTWANAILKGGLSFITSEDIQNDPLYKFGSSIGSLIEQALGEDPITGETYWYEFWAGIFDKVKAAYDKVFGEERKGALLENPLKPNNERQADYGFNKRQTTIPQKTWWQLFWETSQDIEFDWSDYEDFYKRLWDKIDELFKPKENLQKMGEVIMNTIFLTGVGYSEDEIPLVKILKLLLDLATNPAWEDSMTKISSWISGVVAFGDPSNATGVSNVASSFLLLGEDVDTSAISIDNLTEKFQAMKEKFQNSLISMREYLKVKLKEMKDNFNGWKQEISRFFERDKWTTLLDPVKEAFNSTFKGIANTVITFLNKIIGSLETFMGGDITGKVVNGFADKFNQWLPSSMQIPTYGGSITLPRIPALAQGAVIPPSMHEFIARLGDNNRETEVVSPISTMKTAFIEAMAEMGFMGGISGDIHVHVDIDGREIGRAVVRQNEISKKSSGRPLLT